MVEKKKNLVKCPNCEKKFNYHDSKFRPFCSERCQQIDLGHWLQEGYNIPSINPLNEEDIEKIEQEDLKKDS